MDTCMRNLSFVHHIASLSPLETRPDLDDTGRCKVGLQAEASKENVLCPKPCRMALSFCTPEIVKPFLQFQSCSRVLECEPGYEILEIFGKGAICRDGEVVSLGCSPPYCSPPVRSTNPIVHDKQFCNQKSCSLMPTRPKIVSKPSFPLSPVVRVEGFECANRDAHLDVNMHHPN
ncbi:hypothetical protein KP509_34G024300 [Ceratopteris richardii]|uniref:Uncharacterized protein n=1 Tax=Ceratopteris richardii TaxID=49495 RepID=A0A8T2QJH8_CERRI|nr:hypothetical protein KP509_34G024300 [Ceratopteris richardii]